MKLLRWMVSVPRLQFRAPVRFRSVGPRSRRTSLRRGARQAQTLAPIGAVI